MIPKPSIELSQARLDRTLFSFQRSSEALSQACSGLGGQERSDAPADAASIPSPFWTA